MHEKKTVRDGRGRVVGRVGFGEFGWTAASADGMEVGYGPGWNGKAYVTMQDAEHALFRLTRAGEIELGG